MSQHNTIIITSDDIVEIVSSENAVVEIGSCVCDIPAYTGTYEADALFSEQTFQTFNKRMTDNFKVHAINYTEALNETGITVTIGG